MASCSASFGFLPCSDTIGGAIFLIFVYSQILRQGLASIAQGSERLVDANYVPKHIIGGLVLPLLNSLPTIILILSSGLLGPDQFHVATAAISGTSCALISVWGSAIFLARCEIVDGVSADKLLRDLWDFKSTGTSISEDVVISAWCLVALASLLVPVAVPSLLGAQHMAPAWAVGAAVCLLASAAYLSYQVFAPEMLRRLEQSRHDRYFRYNMVRSFAYYSNRYGGILNQDGSLNAKAIHRIFVRFDRDKNGLITRDELAGLLVGMDFTTHNNPRLLDAFIDTWLNQLSSSLSSSKPGKIAQVKAFIRQLSGVKARTGAMLIPALSRSSSSCDRPLLAETMSTDSLGALASASSGLMKPLEAAASSDCENEGLERELIQDALAAGTRDGIHDIEQPLLPSSSPLSPISASGIVGDQSAPAERPFVGITEDIFVKVLHSWFEEKRNNFQRDFPNEEAPKKVKRSGSALLWLLTKPAPEEYREKLLSLSGNHPPRDPREADEEEPGTSDEVPSSGLSCDTFNSPTMRGPKRNAAEAAAWLVAGLAVWGLFSVPFVTSLTDLASALGIRVFPLAFVAVPLLLLSLEVPTWLELAGRKRQRHISAVLRQVHATVALRFALSLSVLFLLLAIRDARLVPSLGPELIPVVASITAVGAMAAKKRTILTWQAMIWMCSYPLLLMVILMLQHAWHEEADAAHSTSHVL